MGCNLPLFFFTTVVPPKPTLTGVALAVVTVVVAVVASSLLLKLSDDVSGDVTGAAGLAGGGVGHGVASEFGAITNVSSNREIKATNLQNFVVANMDLTLCCRVKEAFKLPPGPLGFPIIGNLHRLGDLPHRDLQRLSNKYGPIMHLKLGQVPTIVVSTSEVAKLFFKTHDAVFASRPKTQFGNYISYGNKGVAPAQYGPYWRNMRRLCTTELLTNAKIEMFNDVRREELISLVEELKVAANAGAVVGGLTHRNKSFSRDLDKLLMIIIHEHEKHPRDGNQMDIIDVMLSLMDSNNAKDVQFDLEDIKAIVVDLILAGIDTSATTISWVSLR
ncbi:hypothetical protein Sjap_024389 [Stephania japonica]|uniref:Cytochrome P450 n=1 Tax=Stephania japonica TaxID=461633 RepID=A0AAP0HNN6_9MAGN